MEADLGILEAGRKKGDLSKAKGRSEDKRRPRQPFCQVGQLPGQRGETETPTSNQSPRVDQGRRLLGLAALRTCPLASPNK